MARRVAENRGGLVMEKQINLVSFANALLAPPPGVTKPERQAISDIGPAVMENVNEYANRRAKLALETVKAAIKSRQYAIETDEPTNEPQRISRLAKLCLIEDLLEDLKTIKGNFKC